MCGHESETLSWQGVFFFVMKIQRNNKPPKTLPVKYNQVEPSSSVNRECATIEAAALML